MYGCEHDIQYFKHKTTSMSSMSLSHDKQHETVSSVVSKVQIFQSFILCGVNDEQSIGKVP